MHKLLTAASRIGFGVNVRDNRGELNGSAELFNYRQKILPPTCVAVKAFWPILSSCLLAMLPLFADRKILFSKLHIFDKNLVAVSARPHLERMF